MTNTTMKTKNEIIKEFREKFPDRCADTKEAESFFADSIHQAVAEERDLIQREVFDIIESNENKEMQNLRIKKIFIR